MKHIEGVKIDIKRVNNYLETEMKICKIWKEIDKIEHVKKIEKEREISEKREKPLITKWERVKKKKEYKEKGIDREGREREERGGEGEGMTKELS